MRGTVKNLYICVVINGDKVDINFKREYFIVPTYISMPICNEFIA